jgi:hypothetical protein
MAVFKPHSKSGISTHTPSQYSVASPFTPIGESTQNVPPDTTTQQDNRISPTPTAGDKSEDFGGVVVPPKQRRILAVFHALIAPKGESIVVAATCGVRGKFNTIIPEGQTTAVLSGFVETVLNEKERKKSTYIINPDLSTFANVSFSGWSFVDSNGGIFGENEYSAGQLLLVYLYFNSEIPVTKTTREKSRSPFEELITEFNLGVRQAGRTEGANVCLSGGASPYSYRYSDLNLYKARGHGFLGDTLYDLWRFKLHSETGVRSYGGHCRNEAGDPIHECGLNSVTNSPDNPPDLVAENDEDVIFRFAYPDQTKSYSLYHLYANHNAVIEYFGSVWMLDPYIPRCVVSKDDGGGIELTFYATLELDENNAPKEREFKTKYVNPDYPATADFTNSFNSTTITKEEATQTLKFPATTVNARINTDNSASNYYGLSELSYNAIIIGAASLI